MNYKDHYAHFLASPETFWAEQADRIAWFQSPQNILSRNERGHYRWYEGGKLNTCYLATDFHVENGRGEQLALIYDSPVTNSVKKYTYRELRDATAQFAGVLSNLGVSKGDRIIIYMPMVPEAAIAMLASARLGAVHSVVFGGFASHELAIRIDDAKPKVVVSASCGIEINRKIPYKPLLDEAIRLAKHKPEHCVILNRPELEVESMTARDHDWQQALHEAKPVNYVPVDATDPLYILYTSGTTGLPKGIVRDNGGHAVALKYSMDAIYNTKPGDVYWAASDVGWVVGHSYIVYAPLLTGCTTILFEGKPVKTPDAGKFWHVIAEHQVKTFFTAPTAFRAIRKEDPEGKLLQDYDISSLRCLFLAGERTDPPTLNWLQNLLKIPVIDHWWQTETGWPMVANMMGIEELPVKAGSASVPVCGYDVCVLDTSGKEVGPNEEGQIVVKLPLPPGCLPSLYNDDDRFEKSYLSRYPGYYTSGDGGYKDEDGYVFIMGRTDDVINVAGHRLSTGEMEELLTLHKSVAECAVIGVMDELRGQVPVGLVVLKDGVVQAEQELIDELIAIVKEKIGAFAYLRKILIVDRLPKTRSGKILRNVMRKIADNQEYNTPSTIDDPAILDEISSALGK
ncbi:MAG: propionyl-CoA synthetase [Deferribacteres bacterium]|nr:propionyl-CoA synthetase [candidate division KSB1 bacterium]MCB9503283.1 propionyl-CoA synthetase [Deferribacteres bacterium]